MSEDKGLTVVKGGKSAPGKPFSRGTDTRRGKGPAKGAPNAGAPPKHVRLRKASCVEMAVNQVHADLLEKKLDVDQRLKLVKDWDSDESGRAGAKVTVSPDGTVTLDLGSSE